MPRKSKPLSVAVLTAVVMRREGLGRPVLPAVPKEQPGYLAGTGVFLRLGQECSCSWAELAPGWVLLATDSCCCRALAFASFEVGHYSRTCVERTISGQKLSSAGRGGDRGI